MTWLSEIEEKAYLYEGTECYVPGLWDNTKRMARVIRELAGYCKFRESIGVPGAFVEDREYCNLSPDAKEVIDEPTAPSST